MQDNLMGALPPGASGPWLTNDPQPTPVPRRTLSFGEELVGITFNPSNDGAVSEIKTKIAELANLLYEKHTTQENSRVGVHVYSAAIERLLEAQMFAVKYVTLKY
jgi:hypothetical protein